MSQVPYTFFNNTGNIPLSHLDVNFANVKLSVDYVIQNTQANINTVGTLTNLSVSGNVTTSGNISTSGNVTIGGRASVVGNIIAGNLQSGGTLSVAGNITGANINGASIRSSGIISASGNITTADSVIASGNIEGNVVVCNTAVITTVSATDVSLSGNIVVAGNATVNGTTTFINTQNLNITDKNIVIANGASTSALIDGAGIDAGSPTVAYIRYSNSIQGWTTANSFSIGANLTVTGGTELLGRAVAPTAALNAANTLIATTQFVRQVLPTGVITLWYGSLASIPAGWLLCDGSNGTPDLRDRFIVGAGGSYAFGSAGGSANATLVSHTHTITVNSTSLSGSINNISETFANDGTASGVFTKGSGSGITFVANDPGGAGSVTFDGSHSHTANASTEGSSATNANLPPYYALAYIMKQ